MAKVRIGLIGFGTWVREAYLPTLAALPGRAEVVAVAARTEETRSEARARLGASVRTFADYGALIAEDTVDAVMVAVPNALHREVAEAVIAKGKPLFLELPIALRPEDVAAVLDAAERAACVVQFDFELRAMPVCRALERILQEGRLGDPLSATVDLRCDWAYGGGSFSEPTARDGFYPWLGAWYLDVLDLLLGGPEPIRAQVAGGRAMNGPMLDHGHALVEYAGRAVGRFSHTLISTRPEVSVTAALLCEEGELSADLQSGAITCHQKDGGTVEELCAPSQPVYGWAGMRESIEGFLASVTTGAPVLGNAAVARRVHQALFACHNADQAALISS